MLVHKDLGARRYTDAIAALGRLRTGIVLDAGITGELKQAALSEVDALIARLGELVTAKDAADKAASEREPKTESA